MPNLSAFQFNFRLQGSSAPAAPTVPGQAPELLNPNAHLLFEGNDDLDEADEDDIAVIEWVSKAIPDDENLHVVEGETVEPIAQCVPQANPAEESNFVPLTGPHHVRSVTLPDGFYNAAPPAGVRLSCNRSSCSCSEPETSTRSLPRFDLPLLFFKLYFTDLVFQILADNTNLYATGQGAGAGRSWKPCTVGEIKIWVGLLVYLSVFGAGRPDELWKQHGDFPHHCISRFMSKTRWEQIKRYFHCSRPSTSQTKSSFFEKLEPIATMLQESFQRVVKPVTNISVDECMVKFTGRSKHTVMIRGKPDPVGYYVLALCEAGYLFSFVFRSTTDGFANVDVNELIRSMAARVSSPLTSIQTTMVNQLSATSKAVLKLIFTLPSNLFFCLYCDNLFSTPDLFYILRIVGVAACGTARANCKNWPEALKKIDRKKHRLPFNTTVTRIVHQAVAAVVWQDKNVVQFLTTAHAPHATANVERRRPKARTKWLREVVNNVWGSLSSKVLTLPRFSVDYNNHMGGVDRHDQLRSYYPTRQKACRTWLALFFFMLDAAIINAYLCCKDLTSNARDNFVTKQRYFRIRLAWNLVLEGDAEQQQNNPTRRHAQPAHTEAPPSNISAARSNGYITKSWTLPQMRLFPGDHIRNQKYGGQKWCAYCRWRRNTIGQRETVARKTMFYCLACGPRYPLCKQCFTAWHTSHDE